jgi:glutathione peroxidase
MFRLFRFAALALAVLLCLGVDPGAAQRKTMSAYDFTFESIDGSPLPMSTFRGKAVLLVNTASQCGYTPQYEGLQALWEKYRDRGLVVLGVPSNDFGAQEPGTSAQIKDFCETNFNVDFPLTEKQVVIGGKAHPLYKWLAKELGEGAMPRWNFHKFLIGIDGQPVEVFPTAVEPNAPKVVKAIEAALPKS